MAAKDGTNRGNRAGNYTGAGRKPAPLADKIAAGRAATALELPEFAPETPLNGDTLEGVVLAGSDMPPPSDYLLARQRDGKPTGAAKIYAETWNWLAARRCEKFVNPRVVEAYAQAFARYIQCEEAISAYGFLGKHPTTGGAIQSPFVQMSQSFQKQANLLWYEIFEIVKQNCTTAFVGNPQDDMMEALLAGKK